MRLAHLVTAVAGLVGIAAIGFGIYGLHSLEFIEWFLNHGGAFNNPEYGNISQEAWHAGYLRSMIIFTSFGIAALVSAYGLFRGKRWAQYVWLVLVAVQVLTLIEGLPEDLGAWIWLAVTVAIFALSVVAFRRTRERYAAP